MDWAQSLQKGSGWDLAAKSGNKGHLIRGSRLPEGGGLPGQAQSLPSLPPRTSPATPPRWRPGTCESQGTGEVRGRDCFPEGESFHPIAFPQRAKGREEERDGGCVSVCVCEGERRREARGKVVTRR